MTSAPPRRAYAVAVVHVLRPDESANPSETSRPRVRARNRSAPGFGSRVDSIPYFTVQDSVEARQFGPLESRRERMRIGAVAKQAGVNIQTLRYYERRGLLPRVARLASGYRRYDVDAVPLVRFIKNAQELGFTLREIGELIELRANRGRSQLEVRQRALEKVAEIDKRVERLLAIKSELESLVAACQESRSDEECVIIAAIDGVSSRSQVCDGSRDVRGNGRASRRPALR